MSNKNFYLVNVISTNERRFCFFFILEIIDGLCSYKVSHYYPTNIKKNISIRLIKLLPFNDWFQRSISKYSMSHDLIFNEFCSYFMVRESGTTYTIRECYL